MLLLWNCIVIMLIECVATFQDALLNQLLIKVFIGSFLFTSGRKLEIYHYQMESEIYAQAGYCSSDIKG